MRISTNTMYEVGSARISELQSSLSKMQQQISAGRRIMTPEDDPVGAARALMVTQAQSVNEQFGINRRNAQSALNAEEGALQSITTLLQDAKTSVVYAGNGSLTDTDRGYLATELHGRYEELLGLANTKDGTGNTLFAGYKTSSDAFVKDTTTTPEVVQYKGDQGQRMLQVDTSRQMALSDTGEAVFGSGNSTAFKALDDIIKLLENPKGSLSPIVSATSAYPDVVTAHSAFVTAQGIATTDAANAALNPTDTALAATAALSAAAAKTAISAANAAAMTSASTALNNSYDNVLNVRASVGTRLKELDSLDNTGDDRNLQYQTTLSQIQDLDVVKAYTDITQQKTILEAAQMAYVKTTSLSLFNFLR
ncbi:MAG: flagellar hook-associated protein FlgL [Burkholderiaceae bacterium]